VTGLLSALSYRFVEAPALHRKRSTRMSPETAVNAVELSAQSATQPA
jgi:peptidoglycan/LPS O-acetylase OafA/YrhL